MPGVFKTAYGTPVYAIDEEARYGLETDAVQNYLLVTNISVLTKRLDRPVAKSNFLAEPEFFLD